MAKISDMAKEFGKKAPYCWTIYSVIKKHQSYKTGKTTYSIEKMATESGMSPRMVINVLELLEREGYIRREQPGAYKANIYEILRI